MTSIDSEAVATATIAFYDTTAERWAREEEPLWADGITSQVRQQMTDDPLVIDIGCGFGRSIEVLRTLQVKRIIGVDASRGMLDMGRKLRPEIDFRLGNICNLKEVVPETCDGFWCVAMLMQIPRAQVALALENVRSVLRNGAVGFISTPYGTKTAIIDHTNRPDLVGEGQQVLLELWTIDELEPLLTKAGFNIIEPTLELDGMNLITVQAV